MTMWSLFQNIILWLEFLIKKTWKFLEEFTQKEHEIILLFHSSPFDYTY